MSDRREPKNAGPTGRAIRKWIVRITATGLVVGLFFWVNSLRRRDNEALVDDIRMPVVVTSPVERTLRRTLSIGSWVEAERLVTVSPTVSGALVEMNVSVGTELARGDRIAVIDQQPYRLARDQARLAFDAAAASYERARRLAETGSTSEQALEQARTQFETSRGQLESAEFNLANTVITAPVSGTVIDRHRNPGELLSPGVPIVTIGEVDDLIVSAGVPERHIRFFIDARESVPVTATVPALDDLEYDAVVEYLSPFISADTRTFEVVNRIVGDTRYIVPGMFVDLHFTTAERPRALSLPAEALIGDDVLWYVDPESFEARTLPIDIPFRSDRFIEIPEEYRDYAFIVEGHRFLRDGARVRVSAEL